MDKHIENAINAALNHFQGINGQDVPFFRKRIADAFGAQAGFMDKVALLDAAFDEQTRLEGLREIFFDLLMINFFSEDVDKLEEDYLDSKEWEEIEEQTLDRGTELLNVLLYLRECRDEEIEPELDDFLKEFLLVDEDEFQDEHRIYEDMISNQLLMDSTIQEIGKVAGNLPESSELKELFYPVMSFFLSPSPSASDVEAFKNNSHDPEFDLPVYALLIAYNQQS